MKEEEYKNKLKEIEARFKKEKDELHIAFAKANNPFEVGDLISGQSNTLVIEKITYTMSFTSLPQCVCHGVWLKKDGTPNKKGEIASISQSSAILVKHKGESNQ